MDPKMAQKGRPSLGPPSTTPGLDATTPPPTNTRGQGPQQVAQQISTTPTQAPSRGLRWNGSPPSQNPPSRGLRWNGSPPSQNPPAQGSANPTQAPSRGFRWTDPRLSQNPPPRVPTKSEKLRVAAKSHAALRLVVPAVREAHGALCQMEDMLLQTLRTLGPYAHCRRLGTVKDPIPDFEAWSKLAPNSDNLDTKRAELMMHMICTLANPIATALDKLEFALAELVEFTQKILPNTKSSEAEAQTHLTCGFHAVEKMITVIGVLVGGLVEQPQGVLSPLQDQLNADVYLLSSSITYIQTFESLNSKLGNTYAEKLFELATTTSTALSAKTRCLIMQQTLAVCRHGYKAGLEKIIERLKVAKKGFDGVKTIDGSEV